MSGIWNDPWKRVKEIQLRKPLSHHLLISSHENQVFEMIKVNDEIGIFNANDRILIKIKNLKKFVDDLYKISSM